MTIVTEKIRTDPGRSSSGRKRGRPLAMSPSQVLERIREIAKSENGLFRTHRVQSGLYARARRLFGSWAAAVDAAGVDYRAALGAARERSVLTRRRNAGR